jgi:RNA polymerase sigma-70 factor (ECF subfamily)
VRTAYRYTSNASEVEDIAQDALVRAWRRRSTLRNDQRRSEWLTTIVRNEAFRQHERLRPDPVGEVAFRGGADDDRIIDTVERADLHAALAKLDESDRQLLRLRYGEDLTQQAIARRLGLPDGTVKVRLHRLRIKLRKVMNGEYKPGRPGPRPKAASSES